MKTPTQYYLFKSGILVGPVMPAKLEAMQRSGEISKYSWIIDDANQTWQPVVSIPTENPFLATKQVLKERDLSGAFIHMHKPYLGVVKGIHSFGLELLIKGLRTKALGLVPETVLQLNLADETNSNEVNTSVTYQSSEEHEDGILIRLGWVTAPAQL